MKTILLGFCLISSLTSFSQNETTFAKGRNEYLQENYNEALKLLTQALTEEPANPEIPYILAHVFSDISNYKEAAVYFEKAIGWTPHMATGYTSVG